MLIYDDTMASNAAGFKDSCILFGDYSERNDFVYTTHTSLHLCESVSKRVFDTELRTSGPYRCVLKGFNNAGANPITEKFDGHKMRVTRVPTQFTNQTSNGRFVVRADGCFS